MSAGYDIPKVFKKIVYDKGPDGFKLKEDAPISAIKPKEILVKVHAAAINPIDYKLPKLLPLTGKGVGLDFSGEVVQVGTSVQSLSVGDAVFGIGKDGTLAEYCVADASKVSRKPAAADFPAAASLPTVGLTALQALRDNGLLRGARLLVLGASGGCGLSAVQIAKGLGAHVVGVCSGSNAALVRSHGADEVIDYTKQALPEALAALPPLPGAGAGGGKARFDMIFDTVSSLDAVDRAYEPEARPFLTPAGRYVGINGGAGDWVRALLRRGTGLNLQRRGFDLTITKHKSEDLAALGLLVDGGQLKPVVDRVLPFDLPNVLAGFDHLKTRRTVGKIVFQMAGK